MRLDFQKNKAIEVRSKAVDAESREVTKNDKPRFTVLIKIPWSERVEAPYRPQNCIDNSILSIFTLGFIPISRKFLCIIAKNRNFLKPTNENFIKKQVKNSTKKETQISTRKF